MCVQRVEDYCSRRLLILFRTFHCMHLSTYIMQARTKSFSFFLSLLPSTDIQIGLKFLYKESDDYVKFLYLQSPIDNITLTITRASKVYFALIAANAASSFTQQKQF